MLKRKLGRDSAHRQALLRSLVTALFDQERIETTIIKAKEARSLADKLITLGKRGDLHARRLAAADIMEPRVLQKLFEEIAGRYTERQGGYTRIIKLGPRRGDAAPMVIWELVEAGPVTKHEVHEAPAEGEAPPAKKPAAAPAGKTASKAKPAKSSAAKATAAKPTAKTTKKIEK